MLFEVVDLIHFILIVLSDHQGKAYYMGDVKQKKCNICLCLYTDRPVSFNFGLVLDIIELNTLITV